MIYDKVAEVLMKLEGITLMSVSIGANNERKCYMYTGCKGPLRIIYQGDNSVFICEEHYRLYFEQHKLEWTLKWKLYE